MKLNRNFIVHKTGGDHLLVATGAAEFAGMVKGNRTLGDILELLKTETSEEAIIDIMRARFDAPEGMIERDVKKALTQLRKIGAIDE